MKIYTGFGDQGKTRLFGGQVVDKDHLRVEAYGTIDELNSLLGLIVSSLNDQEMVEQLRHIQNVLFRLSSILADPESHHKTKHSLDFEKSEIDHLEKKIDLMDEQLQPLQNFILPGGSTQSGFAHLARTVCRRAERRVIQLDHEENIPPDLIVYLNRLSDYLFVLARYLNKLNNINDIKWINKT